MNLYLDTSALLPYYPSDADSDAVQRSLAGQGQPLTSRPLTRVEMASALSRRVRTGELDAHGANRIESAFHEDAASRRLRVHPIDAEVYGRAVHWLLARRTSLRTLVSLHLACAEAAEAALVTLDDAFERAAVGMAGGEATTLIAAHGPLPIGSNRRRAYGAARRQDGRIDRRRRLAGVGRRSRRRQRTARRARLRGIPLGVAPAQRLAQTRPGARGAVLVSAAFPASEFREGWPASLPLQVHGMASDPEFANDWDLPAARELVDEARDGELFLYPDDAHPFVDDSQSSHDEPARAQRLGRVLEPLARA